MESGKKAAGQRLADTRQELNDQLTRIKESVPDFDRFTETYKEEGQKVIDDFMEDENLKKISKF